MTSRNFLQMTIDDCVFDQDEYNRKIAEFCRISHIGDETERKIELILEELVKNDIMLCIEHNYGSGLPVDITIEHYILRGRPKMTISYGGDKYDPIYEGDELSALMVKKICGSIRYTYDDANSIIIEL